MIGIIQQIAIETSTWVLMSNANERVQCTVKGLRENLDISIENRMDLIKIK